MHNVDRFAQRLDAIPGDPEPISWGVFPLMGYDALYVRWNGGGGFGDPLDRVPENVVADVDAGLICKPAGGEIYGVVQEGKVLDHRPPKRSAPRCGGRAFLPEQPNDEKARVGNSLCRR